MGSQNVYWYGNGSFWHLHCFCDILGSSIFTFTYHEIANLQWVLRTSETIAVKDYVVLMWDLKASQKFLALKFPGVLENQAVKVLIFLTKTDFFVSLILKTWISRTTEMFGTKTLKTLKKT